MVMLNLPGIWWVMAAGAMAMLVIGYLHVEPYLDKTANGWVFWYTNLKGKRKYIKL